MALTVHAGSDSPLYVVLTMANWTDSGFLMAVHTVRQDAVLSHAVEVEYDESTANGKYFIIPVMHFYRPDKGEIA